MKKKRSRSPASKRGLPRSAPYALIPIAIAHLQAAQAGCAPAPTTGNDTIVCTGTTATPVDAGDGNDTVTNQGALTADYSAAQLSPPSLPDLTSSTLVNLDYAVNADRTAISGGTGDDTITNTGTVESTTAASLFAISAPVTLGGGKTLSATNTVEASATGMAGNAGAGGITNTGQVDTSASAGLLIANVERNFADATRGNISTTVSATSTGIDAGDGDGWSLTNRNAVTSSASAASGVTNVEVNLIDAAVADVSLNVTATADALHAGAGTGTLANAGSLNATATATSADVSVNMSYLDITLVDPKPAQGGTTIKATAAGINGGDATGNLALSNSATINASSDAIGHAVAISLASEGTPQGLKPLFEGLVDQKGLASVGITTDSEANGMLGGGGADTLGNTFIINAKADSSASQDSINVGVSLIDWKIPTPGIVLGSAGTEAFARTAGMDGGAGNDQITNGALVVANSDADAQAVTVSANISGFTDSNALGGGSIPVLGSLSASVAVADTTTRAHADATGLRGGDGSDAIANNGGITTDAEASGGAVSASASVNVKYKEGENLFSANAVAARAVTLAEATAIGIDGGYADYHQAPGGDAIPAITSDDDVITNAGSIGAVADTNVFTVSASIVVAGTVKASGVTLNLAATDTSSMGYATALGVDAGGGNDQVTNTGTINTDAIVDATAVSASLDVAFAKNGAVVGASLARAEAVADATAIGINGGAGADTLVNSHVITARADADTLAVAVSVAVSGTDDGVAISGSVADAKGEATASATGIDGGADNDVVRNDGTIEVSNVTASALAASIAVQVSGTNNGIAAGVAIADTSANATANATGLEGGAGNDQITNTNSITLHDVTADTDAVSVSVSMNASLNAGAALGVAMTDSSTHSSVVATGIAGGDGNDTILNSGAITATNGIGSEASATSASISVQVSAAGLALSAALSDTSSNAATRITGIDGGAGDDSIDNRGAMDVHGTSDVGASSVAVAINAALGVGGGAELVDAESNASTTVTGIDGGTGINTISNSAQLEVASTSGAHALGIGLGVALAAGGDATLVSTEAHSTATAIGIGEAGGPAVAGQHGSILNTGRIDVDADADVTGTAIAANLRGYSLGATSITALADASGIQGGDGATVIDNRGLIGIISHAAAHGLAVSLTLAGKAVGDADTTADARATGIASGAGDDVVTNTAGINLDASSSAEGTAIAVTLAGTARTDAKAMALTNATAFDGGDGNDQLTNGGSLDIAASSHTDANGIQVSVLGTTGSDVSNTPTALALAMTGGAGDDTLKLGGEQVRLVANADAQVNGSSWTVGGTSSSRAGAEASATATALDGGDGADVLVQNAGSLGITANSHAEVTDSGWTFAGTGGTEAVLTSQARAVGLDGGAGADTLVNSTAFTASSISSLVAAGVGGAFFGNASADTNVGASATTIGLSGGADNDQIQNNAALTLSADSNVDSTRAAFTFAGGADIDELLKSAATVIGLDGGSGDDVILNTAAITGTAYAQATTNGAAIAALGGGTSASGKAVAEADITGIAGGDGADTITNRGALALTATIDPVTNNDSSAGVFFGGATVEGRIEGTLNAAGIDAGNGDNQVLNTATITVAAATDAASLAFTHSNGSDFSFFTGGSGSGYSENDIDATATGIRGGDGNNSVTNQGAIAVHLENVVGRAYTDPNGGSTSGNGTGNVETVVNAYGQGIALGNGNNVVLNTGTIDVTASPDSRGQSDADGTAGDDANSTIDAYAYAEGLGLGTGTGNQRVVNSAAIHVTAAPIAEGLADVDGGSSGGASGYANNYATAKAYGIVVGDGTSSIENHALLSVAATSRARAFDNGENVHADGHIDGDANATVYSQSESEAYGIKTGIGNFTIANTDAIQVTANAVASGGYYVSPGGGVNGHASSSTALYAQGRATGIYVGGGAAQLTNSGTITVTAAPVTEVANNSGDGGPYRYQETWGVAYGIDAGRATGAQTLVNDGTITVHATGYAAASNDGNAFDPTSLRIGSAPVAIGVNMMGKGFQSLVNNGTIDASAVSTGLYTTDYTQAAFANAVQIYGDGVSVVNNGTISARRTWLFLGFNGYAIYMGSTQDASLTLGRQSVTNGDVSINGQRAFLTLDGNPVLNGNLQVQAGIPFNLVLNNDGSFNHALPAVTSLTKNNAGTFTLPALNSVGSMTLNLGTLNLASDYTFAPTGQLQVSMHPDGTSGALSSTGTVVLDGTLHVVGDDALYADNTRYHVVTANAIVANSAFDVIDLPAATTLLSFGTERSANAFDVVAHVASFTSVATSSNQTAVAASLDTATDDPGDALRQQLVVIQHLSATDLQRTYDSLSPAAHDLGTAAALANFSQYDDALWGRLFDPTLNAGGAPTVGANARPLDVRKSLEPAPEFGLWMRGFQRHVSQDASDAFTGYDSKQGGFALGYDRLVGDYTVGLSMGTVRNQIDADDAAGNGHANSSLVSVYGGYSRNGSYLDGVLSYGTNHYKLARDLVVGTTTTAATSSHDGHALSASLNGGVNYGLDKWNLGPFAALQYIRSREQAFSESGGPLALDVDARNTDSLVSNLGVRIGRPIGYGGGEWIPELDLAWQHDFTGDRTVRAGYAGAEGAAFTVEGLPVQRDGAVAGLGVSYHTGGFVARLAYRGEFDSGFNAHGVFGGLQYVF